MKNTLAEFLIPLERTEIASATGRSRDDHAQWRWLPELWPQGQLVALLLLALCVPWRMSAAPAIPGRVLILADTVYDRLHGTYMGVANFDPSQSLEAQIARSLGFIVDYAYCSTAPSIIPVAGGLTGSTRLWSTIMPMGGTSPSIPDYRAVLFCDANYYYSYIGNISCPENTTTAWSPAINGNMIVDGEDFDWHSVSQGQPGAFKYLTNVIRFVTGGNSECTNLTGLYVSLSGYYGGAAANTPVPVLSGFGAFTVQGGAHNQVQITATHPVLTMTSGELSNWYSSSHETFLSWGAGFVPLAIVTDASAPKNYLGGSPYILARTPCDGLVLSGSPCCVNITNTLVECIDTNMTYQWQFCVTNCWTNDIKYLSFPDLPAGVTINADILTLNPVLPPGQSRCFTLYLTNTLGPTNLCFTVGAHKTNFIECCSVTNCLTLPPCCVYFSAESVVPVPTAPDCYNYTFVVKNVGSVPMTYLFLVPEKPGCLTFTPDVLVFSSPLLPGQSMTKMVTACFNPAKLCFPLCFFAAAMNSNLVQCCSVRHCLPPVSIQWPICFADGFDGSVFEAGSTIRVPVVIDGSVVRPIRAIGYDGTNAIASIVDPADGQHDDWFIVSNAVAGTHILRAEVIDTIGGVWSTVPAEVIVVEHQHPDPAPGPVLQAAALAGGNVNFSMRTAPGVACHIEYTESLSSPAWTVLRRLVGDGSTMTVTDSLTNAPQRFYRVRMQ